MTEQLEGTAAADCAADCAADADAAGASGASKESSGLVLPLARVKKMMRERADVKAIAADANFLVARAAELLLLQLAARSHAEMLKDSKRKKQDIEYKDVAAVVHSWEAVDFLKGPVPQKVLASTVLEQLQQEQVQQ